MAGPTLYQYLGTETRVYSQYLDVTGDGQKPLEAVPGGAYAIIPGPGYDNKKGVSVLPVPPADGLWGDQVRQNIAVPAAADDSKKGASA